MNRLSLGFLLSLFSFFVFADTAAPLRDYEAEARKVYRDDPDYETKWPIEFAVRVCEGLMFDLGKSLANLGTPFYDDLSLRVHPILLEGIGPKPNSPPKTEARAEAPGVNEYYATEVEMNWPSPGPAKQMPGGVQVTTWAPAATSATIDPKQFAQQWKSYVSEFRFLDRIFFKIKKGTIPSPGVFDAAIAFEFGGREAAGGSWRHDYGRANVIYTRTSEGWKISRWAVTEMTSERRDSKMFQNVTESWLESLPEDLRTTLTLDSVDDGLFIDNPNIPVGFLSETNPRVSIVDIDNDGWDDVFVWDKIGESFLLRNVEVSSGKRGFKDVTREFGLGFRDVASALFADLNKDGMKDVVIGRWTAPSEIYLGYRSHRGKVYFLPARINGMNILPDEVSGISAADVNRDGYLDLFFARANQHYHFDRDRPSTSAVFERIGPPSVLLINVGSGDFSDLTERFGLKQERSTLAAAFCDFNQDGFPDLALGNDFGSTQLFLNENGDHFRDVSKETGVDKVFFGMGISWGDYDNDSDMDLYVTAMQSTAGQRVVNQKDFTNYKEELQLSPRGNILLRNNGDGTFTDATSEGPFSVVRNANWAYGAQFTDFDNDSYLDIFSPNGFFTYPRSGNRTLVRDY
jgi:hypothetical protein